MVDQAWHSEAVRILRRLTLVLASVIIVAGLAGGFERQRVMDWGYRYDAGHDVLPDWLWDGGIPGNPYHDVGGHTFEG